MLLNALFALFVALVLGAAVLSLAVLFGRGRAAPWLTLAGLLLALAVVLWVVAIQNPPPLP